MPLSSKPSNFRAEIEAKLALNPPQVENQEPQVEAQELQVPEQENQEAQHLLSQEPAELQPPSESQTEVPSEQVAVQPESADASQVNWQKRYSDLRSDTARQINTALEKQREEFSKLVENAANFHRPPDQPSAPEPELDPEFAVPMKKVAEEALRRVIDPA